MNPSMPQAPPFNPTEFKPVPCSTCGSVWREVVSLAQFLAHRFDSMLKNLNQKMWFFCAGCDTQVDTDGKPVPENHADRAPAEALKKKARAS